jgi:uncharacterized protein YcbK (DUF882 family)
MRNPVSLLGLSAPTSVARDAKVNEDNVLASFAGVLAGVHQAAKLIAPALQADGITDGDALEDAKEAPSTADIATSDDATGSSTDAVATTEVARATTVAVASSNAVNSSISALNPAMHEKLSRVISRMREETGHDVQVTETYRSQTRQNALYAQGRETAGPVVTWTQNSKHTQGRAVDVTLDGGRANADAYTLLQRIANEEGLRTLGGKDPGHLELPSKSAATGQAVSDLLPVADAPAEASSPRQVSVARVAEIAHVATVAQVVTGVTARTGSTRDSVIHAKRQPTVEALAQDGGATETPIIAHSADAAKRIVPGGEVTIDDATGDSGDDESLITRILDLATPTQQIASQSEKKSFDISHLDRLSDAVNASRVEDGSAKAQSATPKVPIKPQMAASAMPFRTPSIGRSTNNSQGFNSNRQSSDRDTAGYNAMPLRNPAPMQLSVSEVETQVTSTATQRAERIMAAQDGPARPLSQIVMSVDAGNGATDRIQVGLRGSTVSATIDTADHRAADAMRVHSDDLVRSLTKDGIDVDSVRVRSTAPTTNAAAVTTVDSSQKSSDSSNNSRFSREAQWDQQRSQQRSNNERRQHQREQRGGKES